MMKQDRFKNYEQNVRDLVLAFEGQNSEHPHFFDIDQVEIIADYYLEVYDINGLKAAVEYGEQLFPTNSEVRLRRAHLLSVQGDYQQALDILKQLEAEVPNNTDVFYALGALHSMMGYHKQAISYYYKASADGYQLDMIYGNIGDEHFCLGQYAEAVKLYKMSIERNPNDERSLCNLMNVWQEQDQLDEAQAFFQKLVEDNPYSQGGWYCLGCVYTWAKLHEKAIDCFEYALAIDKTMLQAYYALSESYCQLDNFGRAVQALRDSLDYTDDRPYVLHSIGRLYLSKGNYHTASTYLHDAIKEDPSYSLAWNDLGRCSQSLGFVDEAAGYYRRAIDLDPDSDEHWLCLADLYIHTDRYAEAASLLESSRTDAIDQFGFDARLMLCFYHLGRRNRLFDLIHHDAEQFVTLYPNLLRWYPEFEKDPEVFSVINDLISKI